MTWPAAALVAMAACHPGQGEVEAPAVIDTPAVVVHPTAESRASIAQAVRAALNDRPANIAPDALTSDGVLIIDRRWVRDPSGHPVNGRDLDVGEAERFHLVLNGGRCLLVHDRTHRRTALVHTECAPR